MLWRVFGLKRLVRRLKKINAISALRHIGISMYQLLECSGNQHFPTHCIYVLRIILTTNREMCSTALEFEPRLMSLQDGDI